MPRFDKAFSLLMGHEGGWVNDLNDPGGETKYGISRKAYPHLNISALTLDNAKAIYRRDFWVPLRCDDMPFEVGLVVFDAGVNSGLVASARWLQASVGVSQDGIVGKVTLSRVALVDSAMLANEVIARRMFALHALPTWPRFGLGWTRRLLRLSYQAATVVVAEEPKH